MYVHVYEYESAVCMYVLVSAVWYLIENAIQQKQAYTKVTTLPHRLQWQSDAWLV